MFKSLVLKAAQEAEQVAKRPGYFKVTLIRSPIGLHPRTKLAVKALGFRKRFQVVYKEHNAPNLGLIFHVKELVKCENVAEIKKEYKREPKGFVILRSRHDAAPTS